MDLSAHFCVSSIYQPWSFEAWTKTETKSTAKSRLILVGKLGESESISISISIRNSWFPLTLTFFNDKLEQYSFLTKIRKNTPENYLPLFSSFSLFSFSFFPFFWWRTDDELMTSWWRANNELMTCWWRADGELMPNLTIEHSNL